ncbi:hypothetical protein HBI25_175550 [Parastagonospora nodorum]|nr:hypothetical protein HBI25_175550 [Parastagonospora nodorum]KAH5798941.1 hypothetical protein HBI96_163270 [Parastagonospora nodorum]KAH5824736.1 hypothetical protein HBI94_084270 [Parastagonospora nodorum]KAH5869238.1 hypothetical protein HBI91_089170 [Parastagonospora nodorum]KAH5883549.1 hypothetical protein HBI92_135870 [Parastagonospora nodorum]
MSRNLAYLHASRINRHTSERLEQVHGAATWAYEVLAPSRGLIDSCSKILRNHYLWGNHTFLPKYSAWSSCSSRTKMRTRRVKSSRVGYAHL